MESKLRITLKKGGSTKGFIYKELGSNLFFEDKKVDSTFIITNTDLEKESLSLFANNFPFKESLVKITLDSGEVYKARVTRIKYILEVNRENKKLMKETILIKYGEEVYNEN